MKLTILGLSFHPDILTFSLAVLFVFTLITKMINSKIQKPK